MRLGTMNHMRLCGIAPFTELLLTGVVCLAVLSLVSGCRKSEKESAGQKAVERHEQQAQQQKAFQKAMKGPEAARMYKAANFLAMLASNGQLPGLSKNDHGMLRSENLPVVTPNGPYFWSQEFHIVTKDSPPRNFHFVLVQTYSNSDFQLQKAWRADVSGKILEEYPITPAPPMADAHRVFLGPANSGAESGFASWYNGTLGGGSVSVGTDDPATGLSCFSIGITNATSYGTNHADLRSEMFSLGGTGKTRGPFTFAFAYKLPDEVKSGDDIDVNFRFFDKDENFLDQEVLNVGSSTHDSEMTQYKTMTVSNIFAPSGAVKADVWIVANIGGPWTSGYAQFDDFSVTTVPAWHWVSLLVKIGLGLGLGMALVVSVMWMRHARR
jgi:hypothetical protein